MTDLEQILLRTVALHRAGHLADAEKGYDAVLAACPDNADALHLLGLIRANRGERDAGVELIRRAHTVAPQLSASSYANLGNQLSRASRYAEAAAAFRHALRLDPSDGPSAVSLDNNYRYAVAHEWERLPLDADTIVIYQQNPGLGDNLLYSTLPELFAAQGKRVFISDLSRCRNEEIYDLVWGCNPYVSGRSSAPAQAGMPRVFRGFSTHHHIANWLSRIEVLHGFTPTAAGLPKVYYRPKPHSRLASRIIVDVNSQTIRYPPEEIARYILFLCEKYGYDSRELVHLRFKRPDVAESNLDMGGKQTYEVTSIFDLCDAIASARAMITVHSGANSLAAALKQDAPTPILHCAVDRKHYNEKCYIWKNVDYTIVHSLGGTEEGF